MKLLIISGARIYVDAYGMTPLLAASVTGIHHDQTLGRVIDKFQFQLNITKLVRNRKKCAKIEIDAMHLFLSLLFQFELTFSVWFFPLPKEEKCWIATKILKI